jgi:hypothetical protein
MKASEWVKFIVGLTVTQPTLYAYLLSQNADLTAAEERITALERETARWEEVHRTLQKAYEDCVERAEAAEALVEKMRIVLRLVLQSAHYGLQVHSAIEEVLAEKEGGKG